MEINTAVNYLKASVKKLYDEDKDLLFLDNKPRRGMEQACAFRIGHYFCNSVECDREFKPYNVDMEYRKDGGGQKILNGKEVRPDLIVHERGNNGKNLLVVEYKYLNSDIGGDIEKLRGFTFKLPHGYDYKLGVLVILGERAEYKFFQDGQEINWD